MNDKKIIGLVVLILSLSILLYLVSGKVGEDFYDNEIKKTNPGAGAAEYKFNASAGEMDLGEIVVQVPEKEYTEDELNKLAGSCADEVFRKILGNNKDYSHIQEDLFFFESLDNYPFEISIFADSGGRISENGEILAKENFKTEIKVSLSYKDYKQQFRVSAQVVPGQNVKARVFRKELLAKLESSENVTGETIKLPKEVMGETISYQIPGVKRNSQYLIFGAIIAFIIPIAAAKDEKKKREDRKNEILKEYPLLVQKMSLYQATGMNIRNIWIEIYEEGIKKKGIGNPLYHDMGITINELQSGISEAVAYKRFGERTNVPELVRFTALLSQNLKKGSSKLKELLDEEGQKAYEARKHRAVKAGEEAGTKLLIPMMLLLIQILLMIMVPAFISM